MMKMWNSEKFYIKKNRDKELANKRMDRNYEIASKSIVPRMNKILFSMMVICSSICGIGEYFSALKSVEDGYEKFYNLGVSFKSALIMWCFLGIFVLFCCILEKRSCRRWLEEFPNIPKMKGIEEKNLGNNEGESEQKFKLYKEKLQKEKEIKMAGIFEIITLSGAVIFAIGSVAF